MTTKGRDVTKLSKKKVNFPYDLNKQGIYCLCIDDLILKAPFYSLKEVQNFLMTNMNEDESITFEIEGEDARFLTADLEIGTLTDGFD